MQFIFVTPILTVAFVSSMVLYHLELGELHRANESQVTNVPGYVVSEADNKCTLVKG